MPESVLANQQSGISGVTTQFIHAYLIPLVNSSVKVAIPGYIVYVVLSEPSAASCFRN